MFQHNFMSLRTRRINHLSTTINASDVHSWNQHEHSSRGRPHFSAQLRSADTMFCSRRALKFALDVDNAVSSPGWLVRRTQNTISQNLLAFTSNQPHRRSTSHPYSTNWAGRRPCDQAGKLASAHVSEHSLCVEFHCLPQPSSHRSNIVSFISGCLLCKPLPLTV